MGRDWRWQLRMDIRQGSLTTAQVDRLWDVIGTQISAAQAELILCGGVGKQKSLEEMM